MADLLSKAKQKITPSWHDILSPEFNKSYFTNLEKFLFEEYSSNKKIYPPPSNIFRSFSSPEFHEVKVIILGQDPYHSEKTANGLAFSVDEGKKIPPSLVNIFKELSNDLNTGLPESGCLELWAQQGVLLLNTVLTVQSGVPESHKGVGWEQFTLFVLKQISDNLMNCVFMFWGSKAQRYADLVDSTKHLILSAAHPSPLSAHKGFFGCRHFSRANRYLADMNRDTIKWDIICKDSRQYGMEFE